MKKQDTTVVEGFRDPFALAGLSPDTPSAVAFSGGADSVALLSMMAGRGNVLAVHVHHGIRGAEADRDAAFCRKTAEKLGVPFALIALDVPALARTEKKSLETAAREARYAAIAALMRERGISLLLTAHHADDQLETMLQHLLRGSGTRGLCGIPACRVLEGDLLVARPLLSVPKSALLAYLGERGLDYVTDSSNDELFCQRNVLRHRVLPELLALQPNAAALAARCARALAEDEAYFDGLAREFLKKQADAVSARALRELPSPVFLRVMRQLLPEPPGAVHLEKIKALLLSDKPHAALSLPPHTVLRVEGDVLLVEKKSDKEAPDYNIFLKMGENEIEPAQALAVLGSAKSQNADKYRYTVTLQLDSEKIKGALFVRPRRAGDVILSGGMHKAVRRLQAEKKLPLTLRTRMPLLFDEAGLVAVPLCAVRDGVKGKGDLSLALYFN